MIFTLASWLILSTLGGFLALWAVWSRKITRWRLAALLGYLAWILVSGSALLLSQGWASSCTFLMPGKYSIIGYLPVPEEKIYLFLDTQYGPKTCYIPWNPEEAEKLKKGEEGGNEFTVGFGEPGEGGGWSTDYSLEISNRPPPDHEDKPEEIPFGE